MKNFCKKLRFVGTFVGFMILMSLCPAGAEPAPIKVGLLTPVTGPSPDWGKKQIVAMALALEKINLRGGVNGTPVEMFALDTGGDPGKAIQAYREMAESDRVLAVIGPFMSRSFEALRPVTNEEKVPLIATASATPGLSNLKKYPYAFRMTVTSEKAEGRFGKGLGNGPSYQDRGNPLRWRRRLLHHHRRKAVAENVRRHERQGPGPR